MKMNLMETGIPSELTTNLKIKQCDFMPAWAYKLYDVTFKSIAELASVVKDKEKKTVIACRDMKENLILAAVVKYHKAEDDAEDSVGGNWSFEFTTDPADIEGAQTIINFTDTQFQRVFTHVGTEFSMRVNDSVFIIEYTTTGIITLLDNLRVNAKEGDVYEVEEEGYFLASSTVENGEVVIAITPGDKLKTLIKDDTIDEAK